MPLSSPMATKDDVDAARKVFEASGDGGTTVDIGKAITDKSYALVFYDNLPVDHDDITISNPTASTTRFTFSFTLVSGVKIKIFA